MKNDRYASVSVRGDLGGREAAQPGNSACQAPHQEARQPAADEMDNEIVEDRAHRQLAAAAQRRQQHRVQGDRGRVVEQALAFDQRGQPLGRAHFVEKCPPPRPGRSWRRWPPARGRRSGHTTKRHRPRNPPPACTPRPPIGHHQDRADIVDQPAHVHRQRGLEQQHRQNTIRKVSG